MLSFKLDALSTLSFFSSFLVKSNTDSLTYERTMSEIAHILSQFTGMQIEYVPSENHDKP